MLGESATLQCIFSGKQVSLFLNSSCNFYHLNILIFLFYFVWILFYHIFIKSCHSSVPNIQWLNTNGSLIEPNSKYKIEQYGRELLIHNVTFDDEGEYACVANSTLPMNPYLNVTSMYCA